jgi:threonine aldolase
MGGGMRQAGIIAAAGIVALDEMVERLDEDHKSAKRLAQELAKIKGVHIFEERLDINMVFCEIEGIENDELFVTELAKRGFLVNGPEMGEYRFVTNFWTPEDAVLALAKAIEELL